MSEQDVTSEETDLYKRLCDPPTRTREEILANIRERAAQIRQMFEPRTFVINGETITVPPMEGPWNDLPDEETMLRIMEENAKKGRLPVWTNGSPRVIYGPWSGTQPLPKPIVFDGVFLGYEYASGHVILCR